MDSRRCATGPGHACGRVSFSMPEVKLGPRVPGSGRYPSRRSGLREADPAGQSGTASVLGLRSLVLIERKGPYDKA